MVRVTEGYAFLEPADRLVDQYLSEWLPHWVEHRPLLDDLWARIHPLNPRSYRGIGCVMNGIPPTQSRCQQWLEAFPSDPLLDARQALGLFVDEGIYATDDKGIRIKYLLFHLERVQEVLQFAPSSAQLQVVRLRITSFSSEPSVLGFDVGYWHGAHSIICDSIVTPTWHPPQPEDFAALAEALVGLNDSLLFPTQAEAAAFRNRYMQFPWAETENWPGEFKVIQVEAVDAHCLTRCCS